MTVNDLRTILNADVVNVCDEFRTITCGYAGDLLSFVMGRAPSDSVWFTVMTNVNVLAVATLAEVACVVICEDSVPMEGFTEKAKEQGINVLRTKADVFGAIKTVTSAYKI